MDLLTGIAACLSALAALVTVIAAFRQGGAPAPSPGPAPGAPAGPPLSRRAWLGILAGAFAVTFVVLVGVRLLDAPSETVRPTPSPYAALVSSPSEESVPAEVTLRAVLTPADLRGGALWLALRDPRDRDGIVREYTSCDLSGSKVICPPLAVQAKPGTRLLLMLLHTDVSSSVAPASARPASSYRSDGTQIIWSKYVTREVK